MFVIHPSKQGKPGVFNLTKHLHFIQKDQLGSDSFDYLKYNFK